MEKFRHLSLVIMDNMIIEASPTKEFFIFMLTRDVLLSRAIIDLVDNCVDGARRLRPSEGFVGLEISLQVSPDKFVVKDNCGGIPLDIAKNYAFRFGRPATAPSTQHSVGQFGVGMKRTFFKLGKTISIRSSTKTSRFSMRIDVDQWLREDESVGDWHFKFEKVEENVVVPDDEVGTYIEVVDLLPEPKQSFNSPSFIRELELSLAQDHAIVIDEGLTILLNDRNVFKFPLELSSSDKIEPSYVEKQYYEGEEKPVSVKIIAGVTKREKQDGGWYVFCNGRMVLRADQNYVTGWGEQEGNKMPKYHPDFAFFRGFVFFDCEDASKLPWTTTKTGVDSDSWLYRTVRGEMIEAARPILAFLRELAKERSEVAQGDRESSELEKSIESSPIVSIGGISQQSTFNAPKSVPWSGPRMQKIQYSRLFDDVEAVKAHLGVKTFTDVGIQTFEYYREYELNS